MLISPFSAIPSWEGYEYQGHIAIFVVLQKIKSLLTHSIDITSSKYVLQIEGAEDFSIKEANQYLTLHQVKYGALALEDKDKFCFLISVLQYEAQKGYFHIISSNSFPNDFAKVTYKTILALKNEFACKVKYEDKKLSRAEQEKAINDHIIIEKVSANHAKGSKYNILKYALSSKRLEVNRNNIEKAIENIQNELDEYKNKLLVEDEIIDDSAFVCVYNDLFDKSSEVKTASYLIIEEILEILFPCWKISISSSDSIAYPQFVYGQVLLFLKQKINKCHEEENTLCEIDFSEIFRKLSEDYRRELNSVAYQYYIIWRSIQESFATYPQKTTSTCTSTLCSLCDDNTNCNLHRQKKLIAKINEDEIHSFIYRLLLKEPVIGRPNNLPDDNLITRLLTCLIKEIDRLSIEKNFLIQAQKDGLFYRMTLNSSGEPDELQDQLLNEIKNSASDKLLLYETDVLITDQLKEDTFLVDGISTMVFGKSEYDELKDITSDSIEKIRKRFNKPKVLRLIDRTTAKGELK